MSMSKLPYSKFSAHLTTNTRPTYATCSLCHYDVKGIYRAKLDNENAFHERRIITKILKLNKNIQYSYAMTKPMPTGCIKEHLFPSWLEFNLFLETIDLEDQIGHLFVVAGTCIMKFCHPSLKNKKILEENKRSVYKLLELMQKTSDGMPKRTDAQKNPT